MLSPDVRFAGFTSDEWLRLAELFRGPRLSEANSTLGGVVVVTQKNRLEKLVHTQRGRLDPRDAIWPNALPDLAEQFRASWVVHLERGVLDELVDRFARNLRREHDSLQQVLDLLGLLRDYSALGRVRAWPTRITEWPVPSHGAVDKAMRLLCPDGKTVVLGVFYKGELHTALAIRRDARGVDAIIGPGQLRPHMGLLSGEWTRDYRHLLSAATHVLSEVHLGCFGELHTFQRLLQREAPGGFAEAVALRDILIAPAPAVIAVPLGVDTARAAFEGARRLAHRARAQGWLDKTGPLSRLGKRVFSGDFKQWDLVATLGFDPIELLKKLVERQSAPR